MPAWLTVLIPVAVAVLTVLMNAVVNIKIKFAPDADAAARELKGLALRVLQWLLNVAMVGVLADDVFSAGPVTRLSVFKTTLDVGVLLLVVVSFMIHRVLRLISSLVEVQARHLDTTIGVREVRSERGSAE